MVSLFVNSDGSGDAKDSMNDDSHINHILGTQRQTISCKPVTFVSIVTIWLSCLSIALLVVSSKYANMSVVTISSHLDKLDTKHQDIHEDTLDMIDTVDSKHRETLLKLIRTVDEVDELEEQVRDSLNEFKFFFLGLGKVAAYASKQLVELRY